MPKPGVGRLWATVPTVSVPGEFTCNHHPAVNDAPPYDQGPVGATIFIPIVFVAISLEFTSRSSCRLGFPRSRPRAPFSSSLQSATNCVGDAVRGETDRGHQLRVTVPRSNHLASGQLHGDQTLLVDATPRAIVVSQVDRHEANPLHKLSEGRGQVLRQVLTRRGS